MLAMTPKATEKPFNFFCENLIAINYKQSVMQDYNVDISEMVRENILKLTDVVKSNSLSLILLLTT